MITDVTINQIKLISSAGSTLFRYETNEVIEVYHVNQGPLIFRAVIKKDKENKWAAAMLHLPPTILLLTPIRDKTEQLIREVQALTRIVENAQRI